METGIKLVQKPVIEHQLKVIGENVTARIEALNIDSLVATEDSVVSLKKLRAELNKEFRIWEDQRKFVKKALNDPYTEFEGLYKTEISEKYTKAEALFKDKITAFETTVKDKKLAEMKIYLGELCTSEKIDFLTWEKLGMEINLSTTVKKYKEEVNIFIQKVRNELDLIATNEFHAEILVEYEVSLNVAEAITKVQDRVKKVKDEKARLHREEVERRVRAVKDIGMAPSILGDSYAYNDNIVVTQGEINKLDEQQWREMFADISFQIKAAKAAAQSIQREKEIASGTPSQGSIPAEPVAAPIQQTIPEPTKSAEKIVTASFEVKGPYSKLKALGEYMKANKIEYKNI